MLGLTAFGAFHTIISLIAVIAGFIAIIRDRKITLKNLVGKIYVIMTILTCVTGFFIFHHGGFGPPHILGIVTLIVLSIAAVAGYTPLFGRLSTYIETICYSLTLFFHMIPAFTEGATRLPVGAPLVADQNAPALQAAIGAAFVVFLIGTALQLWKIRAGK